MKLELCSCNGDALCRGVCRKANLRRSQNATTCPAYHREEEVKRNKWRKKVSY
jgi:hypothetical protein